jgi:hypothetical protein
MEKITFNRRQLYDLVWSSSMTTLSKKYRIPFHQIRNTCKRMDISPPEFGHWMKLQHNIPVDVKELPNEYTGENEVTFEINDESKGVNDKIISERSRLIKEIMSNPNLPLIVPLNHRNPDRLVVAAKENLEPKIHHYRGNDDLIHTSDGLLDITVAPKNVTRALKFMNALIKLLKAREHDVRITNRGTCAIVFGEDITMCLQEKLCTEETISDYGWNSRKYFPSDILTFRLWKNYRHRQKVWGTGKYMIENQLPEILANLELLAKKEKEERKRREEEQKIWLEKQRIEEEIKERIENEYKQFKKLFRQANILHKANILREYVKTVEAHAIQNGEVSADLKEWITWVTDKISWFDPLYKKEDPVLDDDYRKSLYREIMEGRI